MNGRPGQNLHPQVINSERSLIYTYIDVNNIRNAYRKSLELYKKRWIELLHMLLLGSMVYKACFELAYNGYMAVI